jgi:hypothetical protein
MAQNTTATKMMLKRRGMELETKCVMCDRLDKDGAHLFFQVQVCRAVVARACTEGHTSGSSIGANSGRKDQIDLGHGKKSTDDDL